MQVLEVSNLVKTYKQTHAVHGVSFSVGEGEIVGLLGPNGAGKTSIINMILGVLQPTSGEVRILGKGLENRSEVLKNVNFTAVGSYVPGNMTVWENLYVFGLIYGVKDLNAKIDSLLKGFELEQFRNRRAGVLSSGEQTRVALAKAYLNEPRLLLLDEPTASLDPSSAYYIRDSIREYGTKHKAGVLWTSHNMHEVEAVCDRVLFLSKGKVLLEGSPRELPRKYGKANLEELFIAIAREPLVLGFE